MFCVNADALPVVLIRSEQRAVEKKTVSDVPDVGHAANEEPAAEFATVKPGEAGVSNAALIKSEEQPGTYPCPELCLMCLPVLADLSDSSSSRCSILCFLIWHILPMRHLLDNQESKLIIRDKI